jgi:Fe-S cluster assembly ATPase SufC
MPMINVDNKLILKSMKKVFVEELEEMENELRKLYAKYNINSSKDLAFDISEGFITGEEARNDLERMKYLEENIERIRGYLRDINLLSI